MNAIEHPPSVQDPFQWLRLRLGEAVEVIPEATLADGLEYALEVIEIEAEGQTWEAGVKPIKFVTCKGCGETMELAESAWPPCQVTVVCPKCETVRRVSYSIHEGEPLVRDVEPFGNRP